jgi:S-adenosylmethionine decarboxylase
MKNLAPTITRQRLLIEGYYVPKVDEQVIKEYFATVCKELKLRMYGEPIIFSPGGQGKEENQGYDAFVPLIDSGISLYIWSKAKFFSVVIYTCKSFSEEKALATTKAFFGATEVASQAF